jgi:hypothetical protein
MYGVGGNMASAVQGCANAVIAWMQMNGHASDVSFRYIQKQRLICSFEKILNSYLIKLSRLIASGVRTAI